MQVGHCGDGSEAGLASMTLDQLNDDCLECIFERLVDLAAQVDVARICRRFREVMLRMWRCNPTYRTLCLDQWTTVLPRYEDLEYFLQAMRTEILTVRIIDECLSVFVKELEELGVECLPAVQRCDLQDSITDCYPRDEDMEVLTRLLPNLKYLSINAPISGRYLSNFSHLEELHLYDEQSKKFELDAVYMQEILVKLKKLRVLDIRTYEVSHLKLAADIAKCSQLQVLKLNLNTLKSAFEEVLQLPQLQTLIVLLDQDIDVARIQNVDTHDYKIYETEQFFRILKERSSTIIGLAVDLYYLPLTLNWDTKLAFLQQRRLQLLALCNCYFETQFFDRYTHMQQLEVLCLRHAPLLQNDTVLEFIAACPHLQHLDVSYCIHLDKSLLPAALKLLHEQKRTHTLWVYYRMSGFESEVEKNSKYWDKQKHIRFSIDFPPNSENGLSYVQRGFAFNFAPTNGDHSALAS